MRRIICFGDSNTYGANPEWAPDRPDISNRQEARWTRVLQKLLGTEEYEIIEEGLNGRTTVYRDPAWPFCEGRTYFPPCILSHSPVDLVIVMLGTNDMKVINAPAPEPSAIAMSEFLKTAMNPFLYEFCPVPKFLLISPVLVGDNLEKSFMYGQFDENSRKISRMLPDIYEGIAKRFGCEFMRASDFAKASETDSIHMDAENHRRLAEAICEKVRQIFA